MMTTITKVDDEVDDEEWGEWEDEGDWEASVGSDSRWTEIGLNSFMAYCIYHVLFIIYIYDWEASVGSVKKPVPVPV